MPPISKISPDPKRSKRPKRATFLSRFGDLLRLQPWDMVYVAVVALSILVANRVGSVVHTARDVEACLSANLQLAAAVPACALELVAERGSSYSVLLGITSAARMSRQQNSSHTNAWCTLQTSALQAYGQRSALSQAEQSLWMTDSVLAGVAAAPTACN